MRGFFGKAVTAAAILAMTTSLARATDVEVLHWWTSGGEAAALNVLKDMLKGEGIGWVDMPVAGGGGEAAMTTLKARVNAGDPPTAVQMLGFDIQDWAEQGALGNLDDVAAKEGWDKVIPQAIQRFAKYDGHWVAAPVNLHSTNWVWINKAALDKTGLAAPTTWDELVAVLDKMKADGITPIAHGGQPWQDATMFDSLVLAEGVDFYKKAFVDLDPAALGGSQMAEAFNRLIKLSSYLDANFSNRDWNLASAMVIKGDAGMQFMGDWAKGEFLKAGQKPGTDFVCIRFPGTQGAVAFNSDEFAMFKVGDDKKAAQEAMASAIESPKFQSAFNVVKGSVPARTDVPDTAFDDCGKKGIADLAEANAKGTLVGSMAQGHAAPAAIKNAEYDIVTGAMNGKYKDGAEAAKALADAIAAAK
ncbi:extracellular solute-binding protein [bacterium]|nr:extracellular solute-binding protein [bacterium]